MKAIVIEPAAGGPTLVVKTIPDPTPGPHDLLVAARAIGVNRADLSRAQAHFAAGAYDVAGLESAGEVIGLGAAVQGFRIGDRVIGMGPNAYAEKTLIDARTALRAPAGLSWEGAAALGVWLLTAHDAVVTNGRLKRGESVLIQAVASGVGLAQLQVAKAMGATTVLGTSRDAGKLARIVGEFGLDVAIDVTREDFAAVARRATADKGVDIVIDNVGASVFAGNMQAMALLGRLVGVGRLGGKMSEIDLDLLALKRLSLIGVTFRTRTIEEKAEISRRAAADLWPLIESGKLKPLIDRTFPLDEALAAQDYMKTNRHLGKIVLTV